LTEFKGAVRLFYSNEQVADYNYDQLVKLQEPVVQISARHSSVAAKKITADEFSGLQPLVFLAKGAKIMLTMNFLTSCRSLQWCHWNCCKFYLPQ